MTGFPSEDTIGGRVARAAITRGYKNANQLSKAMKDRGSPLSKATITNLWGNKTLNPHQPTLVEVAAFLDVSPDRIRFAAPTGDSFHLQQLRDLEGQLEDHQWARLIWMANDMAEENRRRDEERQREDQRTLANRLLAKLDPESDDYRLLQRLAGVRDEPGPRAGTQRQARRVRRQT